MHKINIVKINSNFLDILYIYEFFFKKKYIYIYLYLSNI